MSVTSAGDSLPSPATSSRVTVKPQRVLACVQCHQRKIKCNRRFPCSNCEKVGKGSECVPAGLIPRQKRRRFPERDLLDRLRHYEDLLRRNNIPFEPLHGPSQVHDRGHDASDTGAAEKFDCESLFGTPDVQSDKAASKPEPVFQVQSFWNAMNLRSSDETADGDNIDSDSDGASDTVDEKTVTKVMESLFERSTNFLFGTGGMATNTSSLHPQQIHIFKLWQIYLENVNPVLKVTHTPTLQARLVNAASDINTIDPTLEALMFGIYAIAIITLENEECLAIFGRPSAELLSQYQNGCQQALSTCGFMQTSERDCLVAYYLYLLSLWGNLTHPHTLSCMFGVALRVAHRLGLHNEAMNSKCTPFEGEMRRRLWWSLVCMDGRLCERSVQSASMLLPTWNCKPPSNIDDFELQAEMKVLPARHVRPTESILIVVRSLLANLARHSVAYLDFTSPGLKFLAKDASELRALAKVIEESYLDLCNLENPLHFLAFWMGRSLLIRQDLLEYYSTRSRSSEKASEAELDKALFSAIGVLECDCRLLEAPFVRNFAWFFRLHFPFPSYIHILQDTKRRPSGPLASRAWEVIDNSHSVRWDKLERYTNPFFKIVHKLVFNSWDAREKYLRETGQFHESLIPHIVLDFREKAKELLPTTTGSSSWPSQKSSPQDLDIDALLMPMPPGWGTPNLLGDLSPPEFAVGDYTNTVHSNISYGMAQPNWSGTSWFTGPEWNGWH